MLGPRAIASPVLDALLARVSRSFYLSLAILPAPVRAQLSVAYLLARAADTVADTEVVAPRRREELLGELRGAIGAATAGRPARFQVGAELLGNGCNNGLKASAAEERLLVDSIGECLRLLADFGPADRQHTGRVLEALITGMERDLRRFDGVELTALATSGELDEHCYYAAGCVGEFWTRMTAAHCGEVRHLDAPELIERGIRLGKALQMVNVIRDAAVDLAAGRCYIPVSLLARHGLAPDDLRDPVRRRRASPVLDALHATARDHLDAGWGYVQAIPASAPRLRLACIWPLWIGLSTLARLRALDDPLDPSAARKIPRSEVYLVLLESLATVLLPPLLERSHSRRRA